MDCKQQCICRITDVETGEWRMCAVPNSCPRIASLEADKARLEGELAEVQASADRYMVDSGRHKEQRDAARAEADRLREHLLLLCQEVELLNQVHPHNAEAKVHQWKRVFYAIDQARAALASAEGKPQAGSGEYA